MIRGWLISAMIVCCLSPTGLFARGEQGKSTDEIITALRIARDPGTQSGGKCGFRNFLPALDSWKDFTDAQRREVTSLLAPQSMQKERVIGRFRVAYDTTGPNAPSLIDDNDDPIPGSAEAFVDSVGRIFNTVRDFEIETLGYEAPPYWSDSTYLITVRDLPFGWYGQTIPEPDPISPSSPPRYVTHIEIDNDYSNLPWMTSRGIPGLSVTAAHEFHHAIQIGSYGYRGLSDLYYYEITSTWMEDVVFNSINDYLQYLSNDVSRNSQFSHPEFRFTRSDQGIEYSRAIWGKFIEKRYSREMMRRTWELIRQYPILTAIDHALSEDGSSFREAFHDFAYWNLNTGAGTDTGRFYPEGLNYPAMRVAATIDYLPPERIEDDAIQSLSSTYYRVCVFSSASDSCRSDNQMPVIITNFNADLQYSDAFLQYRYVMSADEIPGSRHLANGLYTKIDVADPAQWDANEAVPTVVSEAVPFPNPYDIQQHNPLWFRLPFRPQSSTVTLTVFTASLDRMFGAEVPVIEFKPLESAIKWDGRMDNGEAIATGVYLFVITADDKEYVGKFAAVRK